MSIRHCRDHKSVDVITGGGGSLSGLPLLRFLRRLFLWLLTQWLMRRLERATQRSLKPSLGFFVVVILFALLIHGAHQ